MRALDPRLLSRTRSARPLLLTDVILGLGTSVAVVAQATLLARIAAKAFHGTPLRALISDFVWLVLAFVARGAFAWAMEVAGRRAAWNVLSDLRLALVAKRLRTQPTPTDGAEGAEIATVSVQGVEALEGYFARYLPQVVLACVVPFLVIAWVAFVDLEAAVIMLLTLPLVPVFMWLIGSYTADMTRERWQALRQLSSHFLDVVRGLPTLRSFGRGQDQVAIVGEVSERYRRTTMETLRISFLSGSVLELAATIGVALVAVTAGVRLVGGSLGLQAGLTVIILAPELYLPYRRLGAEYHASADGLAVAERMFELLDAPVAVGAGGPQRAPSPATATVRLEQVSFSYPSRAVPVLDGFQLELLARRGRRARRRERRRQEHGGGAVARDCCRRPPVGSGSETSTWPSAGSTPGAGSSPGCPSIRRCSGRASPTTSASETRRRRWKRSAKRRCWRAPTSSSRRCPTATRLWSATGSGSCRRASAAASDSRGRSFAMRRW